MEERKINNIERIDENVSNVFTLSNALLRMKDSKRVTLFWKKRKSLFSLLQIISEYPTSAHRREAILQSKQVRSTSIRSLTVAPSGS